MTSPTNDAHQGNFIRTVLGDIAPGDFGICDAHEHVIIDGPFITENWPDFTLNDVRRVNVDVQEFVVAGGRSIVDTMPIGCGRQIQKLVQVSRGSGCHIVCPTGLHLAKYYPADHWTQGLNREALVELFVADIQTGIPADESRINGERTKHQAGIIKVAGGEQLTAAQQEAFAAAAETQYRTGCPIITHTEAGRGAMDQVNFFSHHGARLDRVTLSHVDRIADVAYHRDLLASGVNLEYDGAFRWKSEEDNPTVDLIARLAPEFPDQIMVGMDDARTSYWHGYGGQPGLAWLLTTLPQWLLEAGVDPSLQHKIYVETPMRAFAFAGQ